MCKKDIAVDIRIMELWNHGVYIRSLFLLQRIMDDQEMQKTPPHSQTASLGTQYKNIYSQLSLLINTH